MPEGAKSTDDEDDAAKLASDEFRALDINLDEPLRPDEKKKKKKAPAATHTENAVAAPHDELDMDAWLRDEPAPAPAVVENSKETSGVCTPSNPNIDRISPKTSHITTPGSAKLCSNSDLVVDYATTANPGSEEVIIKLGLIIPGPRRLKDIEANVVDTLNARMVRSEPGFLLPTALSPGDHGELRLHIALVSKTTSQILRGTITYLAEEEDGSVPGKLDFKVPLRSTDSLLSVTISKLVAVFFSHSCGILFSH
ncbi:unnamed protein product [Cylicostephanus goldi]|uniref:AP-3 complex subunit delta domain-containing protein n=1 Tax=Cylicostephanus goldi TaxID=71465 RepID=A0A3P7NFD6_CYLGO|nr:unnamed protein product [Cylicostephanus goldi]